MSRHTAMILDPSHENASQLKRLLDKVDIDVVEWGQSGTEWITAFQKKKPDFLLVEYLLPKRDGFHCILKALELVPGCKPILMHSYSHLMANELEVKALSLGAVAVVQRPLVESRFMNVFMRLDELHRFESQQKRKTLVLGAGDRVGASSAGAPQPSVAPAAPQPDPSKAVSGQKTETKK